MNENQSLCGSDGNWFAYLSARPAAVTSWLLPRKDSKKVARLISAVSASWEDDAPIYDAAAAAYSYESAGGASSAGASSLARQPSLTNTQSFVFASSGLTVRQGLYEVAPEIVRVAPFVHCAPDNSAVVAFVGHLLNLQELAQRYRSPSGTPKRASHASSAPSDSNNGPPPPPSPVAAAMAAGASLARQGSIERSLDIGSLTASVVLSMYHQEANECMLLSELQGQYAFIVLDNTRRMAFAARDPSGTETLFYRIGDDGSAAFASSHAAIPDAGAADDVGGEWLELPPGHYITGRTPKLHQFALTPEQLQVREMCEDLGAFIVPTKRRSSLDNNAGARGHGHRHAALAGDGELFGMELEVGV